MDQIELRGKRALVTGGAVRLGRAISLALAEAGCDLVLHYGQSHEAAVAVARDARLLGVRVVTVSADLADVEAPGRILAAAEPLGGVDFLVNNAAIFLPGGLDETSEPMWSSQFAVNLRAPFFLSQAFARQLPASGHGAIVNIGDARVLRPGVDHFAYRLAKSGLFTLTEMLALQLAPRIRVNAVGLGFMLPVAGKDTDSAAYAREHVPLDRVGSPAIVAQNVVHLLQQAFVTGAIIRLDGGEFL